MAVLLLIQLIAAIFCHLWIPVHLVNEDGKGDEMATSVTITRGVAPLSELTWNLARPVLPYQSYMDVYPTRFDIPPGLTGVTWSFQLLASSSSCLNLPVHFLLQQGGLPLVNQSSQSFPDDYLIIPTSSSHVFTFDLSLKEPNGMTGPIRASPGPWYVIAYTNENVDGRIRQKGLYKESNQCTINYMSHLLLGPPLHKYLLSPGELYTVNLTKEGTIIGFSLPLSAYGFQITISNCDVVNCSLVLESMPFNLKKEVSTVCHNVDTAPCRIRVPSPSLSEEQIFAVGATSHDAFNVQIQVTPLSCMVYRVYYPAICMTMLPLSRINTISPGFSSMGNIYLSFSSPRVSFGLSRILLIPFYIKEPNDIGNTLSWRLQVARFEREMYGLEKDLRVFVCGGLVYNHLPDLDDETFDVCQNLSKSVRVSSVGGDSKNISTVYVPYPRVGVWHIVLQAYCFLKESGSQVSCPMQTGVDISIHISRCIQNDCGGHGECLYRTVGSELVTYSACKCYADYRGYGCQDNSDALSTTVQLAGAFLLTMSNFLFLPAIAIAVKRKFYLEAFAYSYTMAFSAFYHACDGDRIDKYRLCIIPFNVLQSADFFGSSCSVWLTLIAMATIRIRYLTPLLQMMGPFGLFIGIVYDKTSLWVIASPIAVGLLVLTISWGIKMYKRKKLYPSKKRYLFFLLPGVTLATTAAVIYSFLETESNYKYLHSMWHVSIALCICFLLPPYNGRLEDYHKGDVDMTIPLTQMTAALTQMTAEADHSDNNAGRVGQTENHVDSKNDGNDIGNGGSAACADVDESPNNTSTQG